MRSTHSVHFFITFWCSSISRTPSRTIAAASAIAAIIDAVLGVVMQTLVPHKAFGWLLMLLFFVASVTLDRLGFEWVVFTATSELIGIFRRLGLPPLAPDPGTWRTA